MVGFMVAAVSPAIDVPEAIKLRGLKLGVDKGIPTLIIGASSIDNVFAITGFSVCLSIAFAQSTQLMETWKLILKGPLEALLGIAYGCAVGFLLWYLPEKCKLKTGFKSSHRFYYCRQSIS